MQTGYVLSEAYRLEEQTLARKQGADLHKGLSEAEAAARYREIGPNISVKRAGKSLSAMLLNQLNSPVVYLLLAGAAISVYFRDIAEAIAILAVVLVNALIGFLMEWQARRSMKALQQMEISRASVIREGYLLEIDARELVPGDLLCLQAGDMIPADGRLIEVQQLQCDESALTGESVPVHKNSHLLSGQLLPAEQVNMVFKGTAVTGGNGKAIVTATGGSTQLGQVILLVGEAPAEDLAPLTRKLNQLTGKLLTGTLVLTGLFVLLELLRGTNLFLILETAVALAVASIPEGLPIVATVALAAGVLAMGRRNAIIKKLSAVETLGSTGIILTDKTGTLTENRMTVTALTFPEEKLTLTSGKAVPTPQKSRINLEKLLLTGVLCNNAHQRGRRGADPLETALLQLAGSAGLDVAATYQAYPRITEIPFSSDTMMMITLHKGPKGYLTAAKGAAEQLLQICDRVQSGRHVHTLTPYDREHLLRQATDMAGDGLRVLGFAWKEDMPDGHQGFERALIFTGLAGFLDPPRSEVKEAILRSRAAGIRVVMVTGDHPHTALHVARKVGIANDGQVLVINGKGLPSLAEMTQEWKEKIRRAQVFARTTPQQKLDIAAVFQEAGNIVAMTGDGINDAPALERADIGIAMGMRGTQIAREAADIVLKDDAFASITEAIAQGRTIFQNIRRFVVYLVSCNLAEVLTVTTLGVIAPGSALLPLQILFLNIVTDVFPALALGLGKADGPVMQQPPRNTREAIIHGRQWWQILAYAAVITVATVSAVSYAVRAGGQGATLNHIAFFTLTFAQLAHVFNMAGAESPLVNNEVTRNPYVWWAIGICLLLVAGACTIPALSKTLSLGNMSFGNWGIAIGAGLLPLVLIQAGKLIIIKYHRHEHTAAHR